MDFDRKKRAGFTVMELVLTIAVLAILVSLAVPSFSDLLAKNRGTAQVNTLIAGLNAARAEAVKRAENVNFCTSGDGTSCGGTAESPWIVALETDPEGINPIRTMGPMELAEAGATVTFRQNGYPTDGSDGEILLTDGKRRWTVDIAPSGGASTRCEPIEAGVQC